MYHFIIQHIFALHSTFHLGSSGNEGSEKLGNGIVVGGASGPLLLELHFVTNIQYEKSYRATDFVLL